jgi:phosphopantetheine adenylyltransferase
VLPRDTTHVRIKKHRLETLKRLAAAIATDKQNPVTIDDTVGELAESYLAHNPRVAAIVIALETMQVQP